MIVLHNAGQPKDKVMSRKKGPPNFRDSETGKFVTEKYAKAHPKTTEEEHNRSKGTAPKKPLSKRK